eukprot:CAMPEP_0184690666 /NCGR_PEP_ID=MMETSP0312-20130426/31361_1 /TAXON_ID=31354 /ORGANISM="Compsopogon coeruleus, Strain SAG 36.94" /LENGTH=56 /DNA_ID=CAMNT_0027148201 /DNA_START=400 /DNA_END=570 /DNA_ORIENTATION=-
MTCCPTHFMSKASGLEYRGWNIDYFMYASLTRQGGNIERSRIEAIRELLANIALSI